MVTIKNRGQGVNPTESIQLISKFYNNGILADLDSFPTISIMEPNGNISLGPTSSGVYRINTGTYGFLLEIPFTTYLGVWTDRWSGILGGKIYINEFNFIVENTQVPAVNTDGYVALGDIVPFSYSQTAIQNINIIMKAVRARLSSSGLSKTTDSFGNVTFANCDIFSVEQLTIFIASALSAFNEIPTFTDFTFESSEVIRIFFEVIVQHAVIYALASKALLERGREFSISDNGVSFVPPTISELLNTQFNTELANWTEKVKLIKQNMKPIGLGISLGASMGSPRLRILRTLRARRIF